MTEKYMVTATGTKDGKAYTSLMRIVEGKKDNGDRYCFVDEKRTMRETEEIAIGTIIEYQTTRTVTTGFGTPPTTPRVTK